MKINIELYLTEEEHEFLQQEVKKQKEFDKSMGLFEDYTVDAEISYILRSYISRQRRRQKDASDMLIF